jgi:hypothetical protein
MPNGKKFAAALFFTFKIHVSYEKAIVAQLLGDIQIDNLCKINWDVV